MCPTPNEDQLLLDSIQLVTKNDESEDSSDEEEEQEGPSDAKKQRGCYKSFTSLNFSKQKRRRTKDVWRSIKEFVIKEDAASIGQPFTVTNLLGYFLHTENYLTNKVVAGIGVKLMNNEPFTEQDIDPTEAVVLMHDLDLSRNGMRTLKRYWPGKFPNSNQLSEERKKLRPEIKPLTEMPDAYGTEVFYTGVVVSYRQLIRSTTASVLDVVQLRSSSLLTTMSNLRMTYKDGSDGSGTQPK